MYTLIKDSGEYKFRTGETINGIDLKNRSGYELTKITTCVLDVDDGIINSLNTLSSLCAQYDITNNNDDDTVALLNLAKQNEMAKQKTISNLESSAIKAARFAALSFTDEQALEVPDLYPDYEVDHAYKKDERFSYNGRLFKVNQDHTSAAQWVPGETGTESLYTNLEMAGDGYLVWTQPTGAHNAYNTGDIVHYPTADDPLYKSLIDGNTWSPDAYPQGWEIYTEA